MAHQPRNALKNGGKQSYKRCVVVIGQLAASQCHKLRGNFACAFLWQFSVFGVLESHATYTHRHTSHVRMEARVRMGMLPISVPFGCGACVNKLLCKCKCISGLLQSFRHQLCVHWVMCVLIVSDGSRI